MGASSSVVTFEDVGSVGLICVDNPPVNAINHGVRAGLARVMSEAANNPGIQVLLLMSAGDLFSAGADIHEFARPAEEPSQQTVQATIEAARVPVVAAINGLALGGGLELAMACHYRLAHRTAMLGLPEITLGIIPGAGGTQRLPRLIGARAALDMILSGSPISAPDAKANGLVDEVVEGDLREAALFFCRRLLRGGLGPRPTCNRTVTAERFDEAGIAEALRVHSRALQGRTTQRLVVEAIKAASLPFSQGTAVESALAQRSLASRESQALRHVFSAERESAKVQGITKRAEQPEIKRVAVIGAGTMGSGIAMAFADASREVMLIDNVEAGLARGRAIIHATYTSGVKRGRIRQSVADERIGRITGSMTLADAASADLVIEAVFEDIDLKKEVLSTLDRIVPPERLIATNTSTLSITELSRVSAHPGRVLGLHFFAPAHVSRLLEVVRGSDTAPETVATALHLAKALKKVPVISADAFGFIGNRMMLDGYFREAEQLLLEGALPMQVDRALETFGFAMGPQRVSDLGGNDVGTKARLQLYKREQRPDPYFVIADRLTELGRLGQKTGRGFYRYENGSREALPDPEVHGLIETLSAERGITRRQIGEAEIVERCVLALVNVGAMVLEEGIAARAADIDVVWTSGYGFPRHLGGPMFYADTLGLAHVAERLHHYHAKLGHYWRPAELIGRLAASGLSFERWDRNSSQ
ncbi:MAG TPA: 3-hydroxyacyl-CoA dehydrogenase NAD-binding domain-containing protein [Terriglobales bacterium]|nr:3-hydroxyacyl-CoA dehydrogenase NAD-binding domain-containing protein [Terriglobales bacterium]